MLEKDRQRVRSMEMDSVTIPSHSKNAELQARFQTDAD